MVHSYTDGDNESGEEVTRLRAEVKELLRDKQHTQQQLDKIHDVLDKERKALKEVLAAARKAVDDLKVENVGLTQALATEQAARIKDREAYQAELQSALRDNNNFVGQAADGASAFDNVVHGVKRLIRDMESNPPNLRASLGENAAIRPVLTAIRACYANMLRKKELAEAALDSEAIKFEMRLLDSEAKASGEAARHLEAMEQLRRELGSHSSPGATMSALEATVDQGRAEMAINQRELDRVQAELAQTSEAYEELWRNKQAESASFPRIGTSTAQANHPWNGKAAGYVLKRSEANFAWNRRWIAVDLAAGVFQLFDATSKKPKASIPLSQIHELQKSEARDFAFEFKISPAVGKHIHMCFDTERPDCLAMWMQGLGQVFGQGEQYVSEPQSSQPASPRELSLKRNNDELVAQAEEDRHARAESAKRLAQVEEAFDKLAGTMMHLEQGNWKQARREVREHLCDLGLIGADEIDNEQPGQHAQPEAAHDDHDLLNTF